MDASPQLDVTSDPRVTGEFIRQVPDVDGTVTLVGVVHDHPASSYRVRHVIDTIEPQVLALELPPISLSLFETYANSKRTPPVFGGEMSAAIQAADSESVLGIDRPTWEFVSQLVRTLVRERPSLGTVGNIVSDALETTKHALVCRVAADIASWTSLRLEVDSPISHDVDRTDTPADQAHHEREHVRRSRSFMAAVQPTSRSRASRLEYHARETTMAGRLSRLRAESEGDILAVIGIDHLDPVAERLTATGEEN